MDKNKKASRLRRASRTRCKLKKLGVIRLVVHRTSRHIYAQIVTADNSKVLVSASTLEKSISEKTENTSNKGAASIVGRVVAERALKKGIKNISFDRSGFQYHGRVQVLADSARKTGLQF